MANGFNDLGFLGDDLDSWRDSFMPNSPNRLAIADRTNRIGMRMTREFDFDDPTEAHPLFRELRLSQ